MNPLAKKVRALPKRPGVYLFKDAKGVVIYVGKAKRLRDRVLNYLRPKREGRAQISFLMARAADLDFIVTATEKEALLLENSLIKRHLPRYNLHLRDDKSYISIRIGTDHPSPGISLTRRPKKDGATYYGPYASSLAAREAMERMTSFFKIRSCSDREFANRVRPCLQYDIGKCSAPCVAFVPPDDYARQVRDVKMFLSGKHGTLTGELKGRMAEASSALRFEEATKLRNAISMLKNLRESQEVVKPGRGNCDVLALASLGESAAVLVLQVQDGILIGKTAHVINHSCGDLSALGEEFVLQHYAPASSIPDEIISSHAMESNEALSSLLSDRAGHRVRILHSSQRRKNRLVKLALANALEVLRQRSERPAEIDALRIIGEQMNIPGGIDSIECIDISSTGGRDAVGSIVRFSGGVSERSGYRIYNIRTLWKPDDYGMMREVLLRRLGGQEAKRRSAPARGALPLPDLFLIDGGKGQLAVAIKIGEELGVSLRLAAIAKGDGKKIPDRIFIPGRKNPLPFKKGSVALLLLMRIRDEAHRFGITAHRKRRAKSFLNRHK